MTDIKSTLTDQMAVHGLVKGYNYRPVLNGLDLSVAGGELCVLVGANGAGKTTLLRILACLVRPDAGEVTLGGTPISKHPLMREKIGYIGHQSMFYQDLTASENLHHYARLYHIVSVDKKVATSLRSVGLMKYQNQPIRNFSRGMQQRLAIARALLHNPTILLFDEPYTGLDQEAAQFLDHRLRDLCHPGHAILLAAHRPQRLLPIATHVAWLQNGKISHHLPIARLSEAPELIEYLQEAQ